MIRSFADHSPTVDAAAFIAPDAQVLGDVVIARDASIWYGCVVRGDVHWIRIGERSNIQDGSILHVETGRSPVRVGADVTVGHRAILHGCTIEDRCLVGMGAIVLNDATIGSGAIVAAGAVVREGTQVPPRTLVAGTPAVVKRELPPEAADEILYAARHYVDLARAHRALGDGRETGGGAE
jgi:carbonic anhydrase/acetyltransferase-like protein (isoleucine patch superfamily)